VNGQLVLAQAIVYCFNLALDRFALNRRPGIEVGRIGQIESGQELAPVEVQEMSSETNKAIVRRFVEQVWNERRLDLVEEFFPEDYVGHSAGAPLSHGLEEVKGFIATVLNAYPDFTINIDDMIAEGDKVVTRWRSRGTHQGEPLGIPPTGKLITQEGMAVYRMVDARIAEDWFFPDTMGLMQQLGVIPVPGEA